MNLQRLSDAANDDSSDSVAAKEETGGAVTGNGDSSDAKEAVDNV